MSQQQPHGPMDPLVPNPEEPEPSQKPEPIPEDTPHIPGQGDKPFIPEKKAE